MESFKRPSNSKSSSFSFKTEQLYSDLYSESKINSMVLDNLRDNLFGEVSH